MDGKKIVLAGECKFKSEKFGKEDYELFMEKVNYLPAKDLKLMFFSMSGFTDYVEKTAKGCSLVSLEQMFR